jgi:hypothetical protein
MKCGRTTRRCTGGDRLEYHISAWSACEIGLPVLKVQILLGAGGCLRLASLPRWIFGLPSRRRSIKCIDLRITRSAREPAMLNVRVRDWAGSQASQGGVRGGGSSYSQPRLE